METRQRVTDVDRLSGRLRSLLRSPSAQFRIPAGAAVQTNQWLQLQPETWIAAGGKTKLSSGRFDFWVSLWDQNAQPRVTYGGHRQVPSYVVVNREGTIAASADVLGDVHVWNAKTGETIREFRSENLEIYKVAWDESGMKLGFASGPNPTSEYQYNNFGTVDKTFDLVNRHIDRQPPGNMTPGFRDAGVLYRSGDRSAGSNALTARLRNGRTFNYPGDQPGENPFFGMRGDPQSYEFLRQYAGTSLFNAPVVVGSDLGELECLDLLASGEIARRRKFVGHENLVTSISQSPSRRMIASSSFDGTMRIWSLDDFKEYGDLDCRIRGTQILTVPLGSQAAKAGLKSSDEIVEFDGMRFYDSRRKVLDGDYRPGQVVNVKVRDRFEENAPTRIVQVPLAPVADSVEPLLTIFLAKNGEWIIWTPEGYYDASPQADKYLGFHLNQGRDKAALWITARQFESQLYRPEVIDHVLSTGERFGIDRPARINEQAPQANLAKYRPPEVKILSPADGSVVDNFHINLAAEVQAMTNAPVTSVRLTVNGFPVEVEALVDGHRARQIKQDVRLLPGENAITLTAISRDSKSVETTVSVTYEVKERTFSATRRTDPLTDMPSDLPSLHVLAVGVSEYSDSTINLQYAHHDAADFSAAWEQQEGRQYGKVNSTVLTNADATKENVLSAVDKLLDEVAEGDRVVIFFSAHGATDKRDNYYLLTHDADPESLRSTAVPHTDIENAVDDLLSTRCQVVLFVDTCHSGGAVGSKGVPSKTTLRQSKRDYWRSTGSVAFMSSLPGQESYERSEWKNGAFTEAIVEAMSFGATADANRDGKLSITELQLYLETRVQELTKDRQNPSMQRQPDTPAFNIAVSE